MVGWHHQFNRNELGQTPGDGEGQGGLQCCSPWGHKELDTTYQQNNHHPASEGSKHVRKKNQQLVWYRLVWNSSIHWVPQEGTQWLYRKNFSCVFTYMSENLGFSLLLKVRRACSVFYDITIWPPSLFPPLAWRTLQHTEKHFLNPPCKAYMTADKACPY